MPITPDFDLGLVDTFEGAPAGQLLSARPNWEVGRADNSGAGAAAAWKINGGRIRVYEDYEAPIVARYGPATVVNRLRWTWEIPPEGFSSIGYDRCGAVMWWNAGSFLQIRFQPQNNRIIVAGGGFNNFYQVNQHGADGGPLFTQLPSSNWVSTTPTVLVEASLDGAGALQIYVNGVYVQAYAGNGSPLPAIDVSAYTGPKSGKVGLYADTSEAFTNGKPMANEFAIPGLTCTRPAVPPALPRSPSGPRRITQTMTAAGGTPQSGIHRIVSAETGEVVRDWDVGIASSVSGQEVTQSVDVPVGRTDDEAWDIEWGVVFTSGKAAKALSPTRTACGFSFCVGGQSNAGGMQTAARPGGAPAILNQAYALWNAGDDTWRYRGIDAPGAMNFINDIASEVAKLLNMPVMGWAWGAYAASLTAQLPGAGGWDGPAPSGIAFEDMKARANGYTPEMLVVFQGENEAAGADGDAGADNWPTHLNTLRNAFRAEGEFPDAPIVVGVTGKYANDTPPIGSPAACRRYWNRLQAAQKTVGSAALKTSIGWESLGVPRDPSDAYHYNYAAYIQLLKRIAWAIVRAAGGSAPDGRGPLPTSATVSGSDLIIDHSLNGATSLSGSALTGYETSPDTSGETFSAVSASDAAVIPGTTQVRLTGRGTAKRWRSYYGYNPDDTSMARGAYSGGDTIPAQAQTTPMAVSSGGTPTPTPTPTPPTNTDAPDISANGSIVGAVITVTDPGDWSGTGTIERAFFRNNAQIASSSATTLTTTQAGTYKRGERGVASDGATTSAWVYSNEVVISSASGDTPRGTITASSNRTARFSETQDAGSRPVGVPYGAVILAAPMDPHTTKDLAGDFTRALAGVPIKQITAVTVGSIGYLDGFRISADPVPFLDDDGNIAQFRAEVLSNRQSDSIFNGTGTQAEVTISGEQEDGQTFEHTLIQPLRNL